MINDEFEVRWFRENTTGAVEDLGLGDPNKPLGMDWFSRYHNTKLFNQAYSPSLLGKYWCQVINTTADPDQPLMRSNVFTLLAPGDYSGASCSETSAIQFVDNRICADLPDQPVNPTTTTDTGPCSYHYHTNGSHHYTINNLTAYSNHRISYQQSGRNYATISHQQ